MTGENPLAANATISRCQEPSRKTDVACLNFYRDPAGDHPLSGWKVTLLAPQGLIQLGALLQRSSTLQSTAL